MDIIRAVRNTVSEHKLIKKNERILVALSGGADSVALLKILYLLAPEYNLTLAAAHVNHMLRPTADRDMDFCKRLCESLGIDCYCLCADVKKDAKKAGMGEELYARNLRYDYFSSLGFDKIATAHNKNDNAETILFHFIRGASTGGLSGIPYRRGNIIRPLLDIKKEEIFEYCRGNNIDFMTDETNLEPIYSRNKLRLNLIPEIERDFNSGFCDVVTKNSRFISEDNDYLEALAEKEYGGSILLDSFNKLENPIKRRILQLHYKICTNKNENLSAVFIDDILNLAKKNNTGSRISLPDNYEAVIQYNELKILKKQCKSGYKYRIYPEQSLKIAETGKNIIIKKAVDGDIFLEDTDNLFVRSRKKGDFFYPSGMNGKKKLSDYFTDKKIPSEQRDSIPLLVKNEDIVSVIGMRNDKRFSDKTKTAYKIEIREADNAE